jgi:hypothetical protein
VGAQQLAMWLWVGDRLRTPSAVKVAPGVRPQVFDFVARCGVSVGLAGVPARRGSGLRRNPSRLRPGLDGLQAELIELLQRAPFHQASPVQPLGGVEDRFKQARLHLGAWQSAPTRAEALLPMDAAAAPNSNHFDNDPLVLNLVDDPVNPLPYAVHLGTAELLAARPARVVAQGFDAREDALDVGLWQVAQVLPDGGSDTQVIARHRP